MSSLDPISMASQLAQFEIQSFQSRYQMQADKYNAQLTALNKIESAMRDFRTAIESLNGSSSGIIQNGATLSQDGYFTASAGANALSGSYQIFVEQVASAHQLSTSMPVDMTADTVIPATGSLDFTINGQALNLDLSTVDADGDGSATMQELVNAINSNPDNPGVNATLVRSNGQTHLMLASSETGLANQIQVSASGTGQAWFEDAFNNTSEISAAQDAVIWLGAEGSGLQLTNASNTFSDVIDGVDITVSKAQVSGEQPIGLSIGADSEATKEQLNQFIEAYNTLVTTIDQYTSVGKPGEDGQKRGPLASDPTIRSIESQLSNLIRKDFGGLRLAEVGITLNRDGKLSLDEGKFSEAQQNNAAGLEALFNGDGNLLDSLDAMAEPFLKFSSGTFSSRKDALQQNLSRIDDKQATLERKYDMAYNRYIKQFTQMNAIMSQMNQTMTMFG
ncbi:flagellar filament capping protein FliD [Vibrio sp.]|uniref:flagellar filament capping protein FliD n=1 Tax=Vibrio sp. TaxID=678 RepID=UPI003D0C00A3